MLLGYIRVSHLTQNESRQVEMLNKYGVDKVFIEKASGKDTNRTQLKSLLNYCRENDIVIVESISRISRNTKDLLNIIDTLTKKQVEFVSIKENIDTRTPQGKFMLTVFGALAELERESILERQREGIEIAKRQNKYKGKPKKQIDKERFAEMCGKWRNGEITAVECMKLMELKPNTFYRRVKEWNL